MPVNEYGLVGSILTAVKKRYPTSWVFKVVGSPYQEAGIPDLLMCVEGMLVGMEVKFVRPGESPEHAVGRTTPGQRVQIARINRAGGIAGTVTSREEAFDLIQRGFVKREAQR